MSEESSINEKKVNDGIQRMSTSKDFRNALVKRDAREDGMSIVRAQNCLSVNEFLVCVIAFHNLIDLLQLKQVHFAVSSIEHAGRAPSGHE